LLTNCHLLRCIGLHYAALSILPRYVRSWPELTLEPGG